MNTHNYSRDELRNEAKARNLPRWHKMTKDELWLALCNDEHNKQTNNKDTNNMKTKTENKPSNDNSKVPSTDLATRISELVAETVGHPRVKDKSDAAVASRVAKHLNAEGFEPVAGKIWTGARVLELCSAATMALKAA